MLRANVGFNNLRIMFPMIGQIDEFKAARHAVDRARRKAAREDATRKREAAQGGHVEEAADVDPAEADQPDVSEQ